MSGFHPAIFSLPVVIAGFRNPGLARLILNGSTSLDGLQNGDDLVLSESDFSRGDLLRGYNQYVGRSLKVNGPFCRDAYKTTSFSRQYQISSFFLRSAYIKNTLHISTACLSIIMVLCHKLVIAYDFSLAWVSNMTSYASCPLFCALCASSSLISSLTSLFATPPVS